MKYWNIKYSIELLTLRAFRLGLSRAMDQWHVVSDGAWGPSWGHLGALLGRSWTASWGHMSIEDTLSNCSARRIGYQGQ